MTISESTIRDKLAKQLELIDPHLKLVSTEHTVRLQDGRTAFIDILAKDDFGCYTVIEIKKSTQTSRSAVQQLYKYASFLKVARRLEMHQIRCMIVSTVWDELMAPFSEYKHFSKYDSKGFLLELKASGEIGLSEISTQFEVGNAQPISNYIFFEFIDRTVRDKTQLALEKVLSLLPSLNCVIISTDYSGDNASVIHPHGFAWVSFTGNIESLKAEVSRLPPPLVVSDDALALEAIIESWERDDPETVVRSLILKGYVRIANSDGEYGCFALHSLNNTLSQWTPSSPKGLGPMFRDDFFDANEIIEMACGFVGGHPYNFVARTTPARPRHFGMIRDRLDKLLEPNPRWRYAVNAVFGDLGDDDVLRIAIFNPLNFFGLLNDLYVDGRSKRIPQATIQREMADGRKIIYFGGLFWTSDFPQLHVEEAVRQSYPDELYFMARSVNQRLNGHDVKLSDAYGLTYEFFRIESDNEEILRHEDGSGYWERCGTLQTVQDFTEANDQLIDKVGEYFSRFSAAAR